MPPINVDAMFRDFQRYTGDGLPNAPAGHPLPIGDPTSGVYNPTKRDLRELGHASLDAAVQAQEAAEAATAAMADVQGATMYAADLPALLANPATGIAPGAVFATRLEGFAFEVPADPAPSDLTTAGGMRLRLLTSDSVAPVGGGIVPEFHFRQASTTLSPKIVIVGDSISTPTPNITADQTDSMWGQIKRAFMERNPHMTPTFVNMAWGGKTWSGPNQTVAGLIALGDTPPEWDYGDGSGTWLSYVQAQSPDIVIFAFGMNDRERFVTAQARSVINQTRSWAKVPDLIMVTPMVPNRLSSDPVMSSEISQQGRYFNAHWIRSWALYNRVALLDLNRQYARVVQGLDPRNTFFTLDGPAASRALPYSFPNSVDQDFGLEISGPPSLITTGMAITTSLTGDFEFSEIRIVPVGGNIRLRFVSQHAADGSPANAIEIDTPVAVPTANFTMTIFVKDCWCRVKVNAATAYDGPIIRHGGRFRPFISYYGGAINATIRTWTGSYCRNAPALSDGLMWGWAEASADQIGGNDKNHPTSRGAAYVYRQLFDAEDWSIPSLSMGAGADPAAMGRQVGIGTSRPRGSLHIAKAPVAGDPVPSVLANLLLLEDAVAAGLSMITGAGGSARVLMGTVAAPDAAGWIYSESSGTLTGRAGGDSAVAFIAPAVSQSTALQVMVNIGGTKSMKVVSVGAADSAGAGFRALRVTN